MSAPNSNVKSDAAPQAQGTASSWWEDKDRLWTLGIVALAIVAAVGAYLQPGRSLDNAPQIGPGVTAEPAYKSWLYPTERNALFRDHATSPDVSTIAFDKRGSTGVATIGASYIALIDEGGRNWQVKKVVRPTDTPVMGTILSASAIADNGRVIWLGTMSGDILVTTDGGATWQSTTPAGGLIVDLSISLDGKTGLANTLMGGILATQDGGATWSPTIARLGQEQMDQKEFLQQQDLKKQEQQQQQQQAVVETDPEVLSDIALAESEAIGVTSRGNVLRAPAGDPAWQAEVRFPTALTAVAMTNPQNIWVTGRDGSIFAMTTEDPQWRQLIPAGDFELIAIDVSTDGAPTKGLAVGSNGVVLSTTDGKSWTGSRLDTAQVSVGADAADAATLKAVALAPNGLDAVVVARSGSALISHDGGKSWARGAPYERYPAKWIYLAWGGLALIWVGRIVFAKRYALQLVGIAPAIDADAPATNLDGDRLAFRPIVETLSRFIRNTGTKPPLTLAIDGEWGSGKSSLMQMLRSELDERGFATIWFNPWHHQQEDLLLPALLQHVRSEGLPFLFSPLGLRFRIRLLWRRVTTYPFIWTCILLATVGPIAYFAWHKPSDGYFAYFKRTLEPASALVSSLIPPETESAGRIVAAFTDLQLWLLVIFVLGLFFLVNGLRAFPLRPAALLSTINSKFSTDKAQLQTDYRRLFGQHFGDVTWALKPYHMVIFLDDLDRCQPEKALEALEATNYLATNGGCFILLGMARQRVERLIGLASEKLAAEMAEKEGNERRGTKVDDDQPRRLRRNYARRYLEKLVQLNVRVPTPASKELIALLAPPQSAEKKKGIAAALARLAKNGRPFWRLCTVLVLLGIGIWAIGGLPSPEEERAAQEVQGQPAGDLQANAGNTGTVQTGDTGTTGGVVEPAPALPTQKAADFKPLTAGAAEAASPLLNILLYVGLGMVAVAAVFFSLRRSNPTIHQSSAFLDALPEWHEVVTCRQKSPRSAKLFGNIARYTAMMLLDETAPKQIPLPRFAWLSGLLRRAPVAEDPVDGDQPVLGTSDRYAVALAAIFHARPDFFTNSDLSIVGIEAPWPNIDTFDDSEYKLRIAELKATFDAVGKTEVDPGKMSIEEIEDIERRAKGDPDLNDELERLRLRHEAAVHIQNTIARLYAEGLHWPPPADVVRRFHLFVVGALPAAQIEESREESGRVAAS